MVDRVGDTLGLVYCCALWVCFIATERRQTIGLFQRSKSDRVNTRQTPVRNSCRGSKQNDLVDIRFL